uniref:Transcription initiation factor IIF subunit alpha n=1 Tax=Cacopsylla melanoneura TaxID=428564 RepID=A0A8D9APP7_9HEMI
MNSSPAGPSTQLPGASVQEYSIKIPNDTKKKFHVMRFNGNLNIDFTKWNQVKLERENNMREMRVEEEQPKFGAGSEFGRDAKDEARRKKFGIIAKKYKPEDQPWILKSGGKTGKKFRGVREGGVGDNAAYYVFTHGPDGSIEAFPLNEWYNFQTIQRYKALSAEEAEEEFGRRNKVMNYFSLMCQKRLKNTEEGELEEEGELKKGTKKKGKKEKDLKISELDEWMDSDVSESSDEDGGGKKEDDEDGEEKKKKKKKKKDKNGDVTLNGSTANGSILNGVDDNEGEEEGEGKKKKKKKNKDGDVTLNDTLNLSQNGDGEEGKSKKKKKSLAVADEEGTPAKKSKGEPLDESVGGGSEKKKKKKKEEKKKRERRSFLTAKKSRNSETVLFRSFSRHD